MSTPWTANNPIPGNEIGPPAEVVVGDVVFDDEGALYKADTEDGKIWTDCRIINRYENDGKRYMMGITSPNGFNTSQCAFVQLALPTLLWVVDFTVSKEGDVPDVPDPSIGGVWVLLDIQLELDDTQVAADGVTPIYRVSGTYFYGNIKPNSNVFLNVNFPKPPYLENIPYTRLIPLSKVAQGMSNIAQQGPANGPVLAPGGPVASSKSQF